MKQNLTKSSTGPMILFAVILALIIFLAVMWNVVLFQDYVKLKAVTAAVEFHWHYLGLGIGTFVLVIVLIVILGAQLFAEIRWNVRHSTFVASVTHELNSPLSSIKLYAQTLRGDVKPDDRARFIEIILNDVERLARMVGNVLRAAQVDQGRLPLQLERLDLRELLQDYGESVTQAFARRGRGDQVELALEDVPPVDADPSALRQVLDNLVDNATKYCRESKAHVTISCKRDGPGVAIVVRDDGIGIPEEELDRIFERFYRIEDPARSRKGTGLGLWIVRTIVEAHGGRVTAESPGDGRGSAFKVELPIAVKERGRGAPARLPAREEAA